MKTLKAKIFTALLIILIGIPAVSVLFGYRSDPAVRATYDANYVRLADGTACTKTSKLLRYGEPPIYFYALDCNGKTRYVSADEVR